MSDHAKDGNSYDFRTPRQLADDVESMLEDWNALFATRVTDGWEQQLGIQLRWAHQSLDTNRLTAAIDELRSGDQHQVFVEFGYENQPSHICIAIPRQMLVGSLAVLFGEQLDTLPEDRPLTDIELALVEIGWQRLAQSLTDGQPCDRPLVCEYRGMPRDKEVATAFSSNEPVVVAQFELSASFGQQHARVIIAQEAVLLATTRVSECQARNNGAHSIAETLKEISMNLVVRLGMANVHVSELLNLQPGDVLVLDQRVGQPLPMQIGDLAKFKGWPGRVGNRQAFQVSQVVVEEKADKR